MQMQLPATVTADCAVSNADIAAVMREIGDLLELQGQNPYRVRAYRDLARTLDALAPSIEAMLAEGRRLDELPGVGRDLADRMSEVVHRGSCALAEQLRHALPAGLLQLMNIPGLGPRKVAELHNKYGIQNPVMLADAAREGRLADLPGFGGRSVARLQAALCAQRTKSSRVTRAHAADAAAPLLAWLRSGSADAVVEVAGSFRRCMEMVGDLDLVAHCGNPVRVIARLLEYPAAQTVIARGRTRASLLLRDGLQVDLRVVQRVSYGAAMMYFTGSRSHNIALRRLARSRGWKLNVYGLFEQARMLAGDSEAAIYVALDLAYIPPELREGRGEIDAARTRTLPRLVECADVRGDLHAHTTASGGESGLRALALAARAHGLGYLAITDYSSAMGRGPGRDPAALVRQGREIERINKELDGITLLRGAEVEILENGMLDQPDEVLATLDLVLATVRDGCRLSRVQQTERILRAMRSPYCRMLAHPAGRLLPAGGGYDLDMLRILRHAREHRIALEVNAHPERLDLDDVWCRAARDEGVALCINSDARNGSDFSRLAYGIGQARRGWVEVHDVLNCLSLPYLRQWLRRSARPRD